MAYKFGFGKWETMSQNYNFLQNLAQVLKSLMIKLGDAVYCGTKSKETCLIGVYHSNSWSACKERLVAFIKEMESSAL